MTIGITFIFVLIIGKWEDDGDGGGGGNTTHGSLNHVKVAILVSEMSKWPS